MVYFSAVAFFKQRSLYGLPLRLKGYGGQAGVSVQVSGLDLSNVGLASVPAIKRQPRRAALLYGFHLSSVY